MTDLLYLKDSYLKECEATVVETGADGKEIVLDRTVFYPRGGGQPSDKGSIFSLASGKGFRVREVRKADGKIIHDVDECGIVVGERVRCVIDWERRYRLMRSHTASHVLSSVMYKEANVLITGNQLEEDKVRFDFNFENFDRAVFDELLKKANQILQNDIELKIYTLPRKEAMKIDGVVKLAAALPPNINELRIVEIPGIDIQADGGTHVKNIKECGQIELLKLENKGKNNRRIYFRLTP